MSMSGGAIAPASSAAAITANERFMAVFWDLASLNPQARTEAASRLIKYLTSIQSSLTDASQTNKSNASSADSDPSPFPELAYALKRLLRGLSSSRDAARQGFALALAEVRSNFITHACREILRDAHHKGPSFRLFSLGNVSFREFCRKSSLFRW